MKPSACLWLPNYLANQPTCLAKRMGIICLNYSVTKQNDSLIIVALSTFLHNVYFLTLSSLCQNVCQCVCVALLISVCIQTAFCFPILHMQVYAVPLGNITVPQNPPRTELKTTLKCK